MFQVLTMGKVLLYLGLLTLIDSYLCQLINRAPHFIPGTGDLSKFSLSENTPVRTPIYQLKGQ